MSTEPLPAGLNILPQVLCLRGDLVTRRRELHAKAQVRQCSGIKNKKSRLPVLLPLRLLALSFAWRGPAGRFASLPRGFLQMPACQLSKRKTTGTWPAPRGRLCPGR